LSPVAYSYEGNAQAGSIDNTPYYYQIVDYGDSVISDLNYTTAERSVTYSRFNYFYNAATNGTYITSSFETYYIRGTVTKGVGPWANTSSSLVQGIGNGWYIRAERLFAEPETTGAASTALGRTFPGGTGGEAATQTYNNVSVAYGTTYYIEVGDGGFVTLEYYAS
jgi:hypothetical protein